jgi:hypothetical protein
LASGPRIRRSGFVDSFRRRLMEGMRIK